MKPGRTLTAADNLAKTFTSKWSTYHLTRRTVPSKTLDGDFLGIPLEHIEVNYGISSMTDHKVLFAKSRDLIDKMPDPYLPGRRDTWWLTIQRVKQERADMFLRFSYDFVIDGPAEHVFSRTGYVEDSGVVIRSPVLNTWSGGAAMWIAPRQ
jgi:hypothetical protein